MIKKQVKKVCVFMQAISKIWTLIPRLVRHVENWELLKMEKCIENFLHREFIPSLYKKVFEEVDDDMQKTIRRKAQSRWILNIRKREIEMRTMVGTKIRIPTLHWEQKNGEKINLTFKYLGVTGWCSPYLMSDVVSTGLYAPSFKVAEEILATRWIKIDDNKIASLTYKVAELGKKYRWKVSFEQWENFVGKTVIVGLDGGRIRTRKNKKWRNKKNWRKWYHANRRESKSFVVAILDEEGNIEKKIKPFYDACIWTPEEFFEMLALYLVYGEIGNAKQVCVVADGAKRIRDKTKKKLEELWVSPQNITEVLDYYHAVEHLWKFAESIKSLTSKQKKKLIKQWKKLLWKGKVDELLEDMLRYCRWRNAWVMKKERNYFDRHRCRLHYSLFRKMWLICGSGIVESMIRRTTNLRLKGNWIFWKLEHAQKSLFLRSQLISWRRQIMIGNMLTFDKL